MTAVSVDGARNFPGVDLAADTEVALDIEVIGAAANEAAIVVYFAPNTDKGFIDAVSTAVHDAVHKPSVISISWGRSEDEWSAQASTQMEQILIDAAGLGITVTVASGDDGSRDRETRRPPARRFPGLRAARARLWRHVTAHERLRDHR